MTDATVDGKPIVEARELPLEDWLKIILTPNGVRNVCLYPDYCFPSDQHRDEYLSKITSRDRLEIKALIRAFLMPTGSLGCDRYQIAIALKETPVAALNVELVRRALRGEIVWEGITWVLDLLHRPRMAIDVIDAYLAAHFWWMPDWRIDGLLDAMKLIRVAYLEPIQPRDELLSMSPRDFEFVIAHLFQRMDFDVTVTQQTADGGFDIKLRRSTAGNVESSVVECKRYTQNVSVKEMRALLGVVERDSLTRGILVTTAGFTRSTCFEASRMNRIELIDFPKLCSLLNEHFGRDWLINIDYIITQARREFERKDTQENNA